MFTFLCTLLNLKKIAPVITIGIIAILVVTLVIVFLPSGQRLTPGSKKAIILSSANDFNRKDGEVYLNIIFYYLNSNSDVFLT